MSRSHDGQAYLEVFRRLLDEPLPKKPPEEKLPIWESLGFWPSQAGNSFVALRKYARVALAHGTENGKARQVELDGACARTFHGRRRTSSQGLRPRGFGKVGCGLVNLELIGTVT